MPGSSPGRPSGWRLRSRPSRRRSRNSNGSSGFGSLNERAAGCSLTDAGSAFVTEARRILQASDRLSAAMLEFAGGIRGRLFVGTTQLFSELTLPSLLGRFHRSFPEIEVALREDVTAALIEGLRSSALDVAIVNVHDPADHPDLVIHLLYSDVVAAAVSPSHRLARRKRVTLAELRDEPFVAFKAGSGLHASLMAAAHAHGFEPRVSVESGDSSTLRALASEGLGVALLPKPYLESPGPPVSVIALEAPVIERRLSLAYRERSLSPAARAFVDFLARAISAGRASDALPSAT